MVCNEVKRANAVLRLVAAASPNTGYRAAKTERFTEPRFEKAHVLSGIVGKSSAMSDRLAHCFATIDSNPINPLEIMPGKVRRSVPIKQTFGVSWRNVYRRKDIQEDQNCAGLPDWSAFAFLLPHLR